MAFVERDVFLLFRDVLQFELMQLFSFFNGDFQSFAGIVQNRIIFIGIISNIFEFDHLNIHTLFLLLLICFVFFHFQDDFLIYLSNRIVRLDDILSNSWNFFILSFLPLHNIFNEMIPKVNLLICLFLFTYFSPWINLLLWIIIKSYIRLFSSDAQILLGTKWCFPVYFAVHNQIWV